MSPDGLRDGVVREGGIGGPGMRFVDLESGEQSDTPSGVVPQPKRLEEVAETTCVVCGTKFPVGEAHSPIACQAAQEAKRTDDPSWQPGAEAAAALNAAEGLEGGDGEQPAPEARDELEAARTTIASLLEKISDLESKLMAAGIPF